MKIYEANGNRFMIAESQHDRSKNIKQHQCDGMIIHHNHELKFELYNADGTQAYFSGNGLHCYFHYLIDQKIITHSCEISYQNKYAKLTCLNQNPFISQLEISLPQINQNRIEMGNSHLIKLCESTYQAKDLCEKEEANISYINEISSHRLEVKTYERGVGWSESCGSGAIASGYYCYYNGLCENEIEIVNPSGIHHLIIQKDVIQLITPSQKSIHQYEEVLQ